MFSSKNEIFDFSALFGSGTKTGTQRLKELRKRALFMKRYWKDLVYDSIAATLEIINLFQIKVIPLTFINYFSKYDCEVSLV